MGKVSYTLLTVLNSGRAGAGGCVVAVSPAEDVIRFGVFEFDLKAGQLSRYGTKLPGRSLAIPIGPEETLPELPADGIEPSAQLSVVPGSQSVGRAELVPGKDLAHFAYVKTTSQRNLYRVSLP
jgi:hypothetical protein